MKNNKKYGFIYIWYDRKHKRYYIGSHWGNENDGYICSSNWMRDAYKRRPNDFKRRIIQRIYSNRNELLDEEQRWLSYIKVDEIKNRYYNLCKTTKNPWWTDDENRLNIGEKISKSRTGKKYSKRGPRSSEVKEKISNSLKQKYKKGMKNPNIIKYNVMLNDGTLSKLDKTELMNQQNMTHHQFKALYEWSKKNMNKGELHPKFNMLIIGDIL